MERKITGFALCALLFALCVAAEAQQPKKIPRIGYLSSQDPRIESTRSDGILLALRERGHIEGQNIVFEYRYAEESKIGILSLRPSWCVSRLISSWQREGAG
jgi:putative ABC transport system substrate-binding protein